MQKVNLTLAIFKSVWNMKAKLPALIIPTGESLEIPEWEHSQTGIN